MYPRDLGAPLQKWAHTQVAVGARMASYHDEIKVCLPAILTPQQHLLFTLFHVDLQTKLEAPKPVSPCSLADFVSILTQLHFSTGMLIVWLRLLWFFRGICVLSRSLYSYPSDKV